jgi:transcriptional regulator with XRE-family HTH domain
MNHDYILYRRKDELKHTGTKRHSGRYDWGSGENPYQHEPWFAGWGSLTPKEQTEYAKSSGMTLKEMRYRYAIGKSMEKANKIAHAKELRYTKQMSVKAIAEKMKVSETTIDSWLKPSAEENARQIQKLSDQIADYAGKHAAVDIGKGCATAIGITPTKLETAIQLLNDKGYYTVKWDQEQQTTTHKTHSLALVAPKPEWKNMTDAEIKKDAYKTVMDNINDVALPFEIKYRDDIKTTVSGFDIPKSMPSSKLEVIYADDDRYGGRDGLIEVRRGNPDLDLGGNYAQVRIAVDDTHYIKGMACYADDLPPGKEIRVYSKRKSGTKLKGVGEEKAVLKPMKTDDKGEVDLEDPFGAQIMDQKGFINKVNEEGSWGDWTSAKTLASQVLSKQSPELAKRQLDLRKTEFQEQFDEIMSITNPIIRQKKLEDFAEECDKAAVHLKAAALPGQSVKVLLPIPSLKVGECYCPMYKDGTKLALIRYPHGSKAEIPIVTVNNSNKEGKRVLTNEAVDAIGLNPKDAQRLSGADFDGDTVVAIPNNKNFIESKPAYKAMENFDTSDWPGYEGMKPISHSHQQKMMGVVTNLITDMTLLNANDDEMVRAIKFSMVIIDSEKHKLNWKGAYEEYRISELHEKYQGKKTGGAQTIISKSSGEKHIAERKEYPIIDPKTGRKTYEKTNRRRSVLTDPNTGEPIISAKTGKPVWKNLAPYQKGYDPEGELVTEKTTNMADTDDAYTLVSKFKHPMEIVYANYANDMKAMGNKARLESLKIEDTPYNSEAAKIYEKEVKSLKEKIDNSKVNAALERVAQRAASVIINDRVSKYPERYNKNTTDGKKHLSKLKSQVTNRERAVVCKQKPFEITEREWEAIQAGALRKTDVREIVNRADSTILNKYALPKKENPVALSDGNIARAKAMLNSGFTQAEVADAFNISPTTLRNLVKPKKGE